MDRQQDVIRTLTAHIIAYRFRLENERLARMSRLRDKLELASGVVARVSAKIEAKADEVIAREAVIDGRTEEAFAPHYAHLDDAMAGLDELERELGQMTNDPLKGSGRPLESVLEPKLIIDETVIARAKAAGKDPVSYRMFENGTLKEADNA